MISNISADPITLIKKTGPLLSMQNISTVSSAQSIYTWTRIHKNYSDCWAAAFFLSKLLLCMHTPLCQAAAVTKKEEGKGVFMWRVWIRYKGERLRWVYPADCHFTVKRKLAHPKSVTWNTRLTSLQKLVINVSWQSISRAAEATAWAHCPFAALYLFALQWRTTVSPWLTTVEKQANGGAD